jgi:hypothetical protein
LIAESPELDVQKLAELSEEIARTLRLVVDHTPPHIPRAASHGETRSLIDSVAATGQVIRWRVLPHSVAAA